MNNSVIVESIKKLCKDNNITVSQLEKETGMSQGLVSKWKDKIPSLDKIVDIANYFNVTIDEVIGRTIKAKQNGEQKFIDKLYRETINDSIDWKDQAELVPELVKGDSNIEDDGYEYFELYTTQYNDGTIYLYAQYDKEKGIISDIDIQLYIRPDITSELVIQEYDKAKLYDLWYYLQTKFYGKLDEIRVEEFKNNFVLNKSLTNSDDLLSGNLNNGLGIDVIEKIANDPSVKKIMELYSMPGFQQLQKTISSTEFQKAMQVANMVQKYFDRLDINNK